MHPFHKGFCSRVARIYSQGLRKGRSYRLFFVVKVFIHVGRVIPQHAAMINGKVTRRSLLAIMGMRRRVGFGELRLETPQLCNGALH